MLDLSAQGNAAEIVAKIFNTLFIMGLNQEQFKEKLSTIYGANDWPDYQDLSAELHIFAEATERMNELRKDNNEGKISANVVVNDSNSTRACWNCGSVEHQRSRCPKPSRKCSKCGMLGHMEKF